MVVQFFNEKKEYEFGLHVPMGDLYIIILFK